MPGKCGVVRFMLEQILKRIGSRNFKTLSEGQMSCQQHDVLEKTLRKVVAIIQIIVFLDVTPCRLVNETRRFGGTFCLQPQVRVRKRLLTGGQNEISRCHSLSRFAISHIHSHL